MMLICISQTARLNIDVVSARQLAFLENLEKSDLNSKQTKRLQLKENGLSIKLSCVLNYNKPFFIDTILSK